MKDVSIIICAYNEEQNIAGVVEACCTYNPMADVLVVDDGSTDRTVAVLKELRKQYNFRIELLQENQGKSWAMVHGVEHCKAEIILFFDADVSMITRQHFHSLLSPIREGRADMVLGQPRETMIDYRINPFKSLTGERAMLRKDLLLILEDIREIRFGVETFINLYYRAEGKRIQYVLLEGLSHPNTFEKTSKVMATKKYISEGQEIAVTYMNNYYLIVQRIENKINHAGKNTTEKISKIQVRINQEIAEFINNLVQ